jgi:hypothetical protein
VSDQTNRFERAIEAARMRQQQMQMTHSQPRTETDVPQRGSILGPLAQGATFGLADEARGAMEGVGAMMQGGEYGPAYAQGRDRMRNDIDAYTERNPNTAMAAEVLGAAPTAFIPGAGVARSATLGQAARRGAAVGAGGGALYGFGQGEGQTDRMVGAGVGGVAGAALGAGLPMAGAGARSAMQAATDYVRPNAATQAGVGRPAQRHIQRTLEADDQTIQSAGQKVQRYGPEAALVDASPGLRAAGETMVQTGRPGAQALERMARQRQQATPARINRAFESVLGPRPDAAGTIDALQQALQKRAAQQFGAAKQAAPPSIPYDPSLQPVLNAERQAMQRARVPEGDLPDDSYDFLSHVQKRLTDERRTAESGQRMGFRRSSEVGALRSDESLLVDALDQATGGLYQPARQSYRDGKAAEEAFDYGFRKALSTGEEISFFRKWWKEATPEERDAARVGIRARLGELAGSVRRGKGAARDVMSEGDVQGKLRTAFGKDVTGRLSEVMEGQQQIWTSNDVLQSAGGSRTARAQANDLNPGNSRIDPGTSLLGLVGRGAGKALDVMRDPVKMTRDLSDALSRQGADRDSLVQALSQSLPQQAPPAQRMLMQLLMDATDGARAGTSITQPGVPDIGPEPPRRRQVPTITVRPRPQ